MSYITFETPAFLEPFFAKFDNIFNRREPQTYFRLYCTGLLFEIKRKNVQAIDSHIIDGNSQELMKNFPHDFSRIATSADGKDLAGMTEDGIYLWDMQEQQEVGVLNLPEVDFGFPLLDSVSISPNGKLLAWVLDVAIPTAPSLPGQDDGIRQWEIPAQAGIHLWNIQEQAHLGVFQEGLSFAINPDEKTIAVTGSRTIKLWDVQTQQQVGQLEHRNRIVALAISPDGKWLASGSSDGVILLWEMNLPDSVSVEPRDKLVVTFGGLKQTALLQNYPNPFNPETWIPFVLGEPADVEIHIYDAASHLVRTMQSGQKTAGIYQNKAQAAYWDGKNNSGESVSSGVYFYEMRVGRNTFVRKAMLLK